METKQVLFYAFWKEGKHEIMASSLWEAKELAVKQLKVPASKRGLLAVVSAKSMENEDFKSL